jgi:hypothetical protein
MRMCNMALTAPVKNWSPRFKAQKKQKREPADPGQRNTVILTYFPTRKGALRMEGLKHYFHADMAEILEMDRTVDHWTARTERFEFADDKKSFSMRPDFMATGSGGPRAIRLLKATEENERRRERHAQLRQRFAEIGIAFEVMTDVGLANDTRTHVAKELRYHRYRDRREGLALLCVEAFQRLPKPTLGAIHVSLGGDNDLWFELLSHTSRGFLEIDLIDGLSADTPVHACKLEGYCDE